MFPRRGCDVVENSSRRDTLKLKHDKKNNAPWQRSWSWAWATLDIGHGKFVPMRKGSEW